MLSEQSGMRLLCVRAASATVTRTKAKTRRVLDTHRVKARSKNRQLNVDVVAGGVGVRADLVGLGDQGFRVGALNARQDNR